MTDRNEHDVDEQLLEQIDAHYRPADLSPGRRVALNEDLWQRIERKKPLRRGLAPALAGAACVATVAWFILPWRVGPTSAPSQPAAVVARVSVPTPPASRAAVRTTPRVGARLMARLALYDEWEYGLLYPRELHEVRARSLVDDAGLPDDYRGIATVLTDG